MEKRLIYADAAATTRISPYVLEKMMPYLTEQFGNASAVHRIGRTMGKNQIDGVVLQ